VIDRGQQMWVALDRRQAALERERAASDREAAAGDREQAAQDRQLAAEDRQEAKEELLASAKDNLTGALRRSGGLLALQREVDRSRRSGDHLAVAFLDVDGLKHINDEHGHSAGDKALRAVADGLRKSMRSYDVIMRFGGDEFVCALPGLDITEATARLVMVRAELATAPEPVLVSYGVAELQPDDSIDTLIARADAALYEERRGRTRAGDRAATHTAVGPTPNSVGGECD
jgi:diguanylate cyclase (GGDEF)-like protein